MTDRKLHRRFFGEFRLISQIWEATAAKRRPILQRQRCITQNVLYNTTMYVPCIDLLYISSLGGLHIRTAVTRLP